MISKGNIILIRGLPGSGKTTLANLLSENGKYPICSVDEFFTDADGNYKFDHRKNHVAYEECRKKVITHMENIIEKVLVDNTFTLDWEMEPYFLLAKKYGYKIFVLTVENYHGNSDIHGITEEQMQKMAEKYRVKLKP